MVRAFLGNCAEVTHCMLVASEPVQVGGLGKDEPVAGVLNQFIVAIGNDEGRHCPCWGLVE